MAVMEILDSLIKIGEVVDASIKTLTELTSTYRNIPSEAVILIGQLHITQTAINRLETAWNSQDFNANARYQELATRMGTILECLAPFMFKLQKKLGNVNNYQDITTVKNKISFLWNDKETSNCCTLIDRQVNALNLLVQAIQCSTWAEQQRVIYDDESQLVFQLAQDCSSSLIVSCDQENTVPGNSDAVGAEFKFDTLVHERTSFSSAHRSCLRQAIKSNCQRSGSPGQKTKDIRSISLDHSMNNDDQGPSGVLSVNNRNLIESSLTCPKSDVIQEIFDLLGRIISHGTGLSSPTHADVRPKRTLSGMARQAIRPRYRQDHASQTAVKNQPLVVKILLVGTSESGKTTLLKCLKPLMGQDFSRKHRAASREVVFSNFVQSFQTILEAMKNLELSLSDNRNEHHAKVMISQPQFVGGDHLDSGVIAAAKALWLDKGFQKCYERRREYQLAENLEYFVRSADRMKAAGYTPSAEDVLRSRVKTTGATDHAFSLHHSPCRLIDVGGTRSERKKWRGVLEDVDLMIFTVDASAHNKVLWENAGCNRLDEDLIVFDTVVNSQWCGNNRLLLVFSHMDLLEQRLKEFHPARIFTDFNPGIDEGTPSVQEWMTYLEHRFTSLCQSTTYRDSIRIVRANLVDFESHKFTAKELLRASQAFLLTR